MDTKSNVAEKVIKREKVGKYIYEQGESGKWRCPVCGHFSLNEPDDWDYCPICDSLNSHVYVTGHSRIGEKMNFDEAKKAWQERNPSSTNV